MKPPIRVLALTLLLVSLTLAPRIARADLLKVGDPAPDFSTQAIVGDQTETINLSALKDRTVVLYFYPKDFTSGCTKEACAFRDGYAKLKKAGIVLLGCSIDTADSHRSFIKQYNLPFPLLVDPDKKIADAYGVENGIIGLGLDSRVTYVIKDGKIVSVYPKVDPALNASQIIHDFGSSQPSTAMN
ncbi:MAG TPA: peroxiredoxin [Candidatus Binataceae bacterium]|nr:peroxiredoxin [Candidatus Binataceae bacterium]